MKKNFTNYEIVQMLNNSKGYEAKRLPQRVSYAIMKNLMTINKENEIYSKQLSSILAEYKDNDKYELDSEGNPVYDVNSLPVIKEEFKADFMNDISELLNFKVEVELCTVSEEALNYDDMDKYDALTTSEMFNLLKLICSNENA